tara:strand:- start:506 stop:1201 length:696 start_codon:yes stop_codon:yes gene_type:complete
MRKIVVSIFVILFVTSIPATESFAFFGIWKNANPKCGKYDFQCKRKSPKMTEEEVERMSSEEIQKIKKQKPQKKTKKIAKKQTIKTNQKHDTEMNFFTGMFDFSDHKQKSGVLGLQHQDDSLFRNTFLGRLSPITGGFITEKNAFYIYTGAQAEYDFGFVTITPSFAPGYYNYGDGKDLGYPLEFKSEVQMSVNFSDNTQFGMSYNHISNASLGSKNPGANSYMFNLLKQF